MSSKKDILEQEDPDSIREPANDPHEGWTTPQPEHVPRPTYWPAVMALGVTFLAWGVVTTYVISAVGLVLFMIALAGWIGELRRGE